MVCGCIGSMQVSIVRLHVHIKFMWYERHHNFQYRYWYPFDACTYIVAIPYMVTFEPLDILWIFEISRPIGYQILLFLWIFYPLVCIYIYKGGYLYWDFHPKFQLQYLNMISWIQRGTWIVEHITLKRYLLTCQASMTYFCRNYITLFSITSTLALVHGFRPHTPKITLIYCNFVIVKYWNFVWTRVKGAYYHKYLKNY